MLNSRPNNKNYHQGNYVPNNPEKITKLNKEGGVYYRSGLEKKMMIWLDNNDDIVSWNGETLKIPYQLIDFKTLDVTSHVYYPDFVYKIKDGDEYKTIVVEVKPWKEYAMVLALNEGKMKVPDKGLKKMRNFEFDFKMAYRNKHKWEAVIKWCNLRGHEFIVITEKTFQKYGIG